MTQEIWLPKSTTSVTVTTEGKVTVTTSMEMTPKKLAAPVGFKRGGA